MKRRVLPVVRRAVVAAVCMCANAAVKEAPFAFRVACCDAKNVYIHVFGSTRTPLQRPALVPLHKSKHWQAA